jgi:hypothetical protein
LVAKKDEANIARAKKNATEASFSPRKGQKMAKTGPKRQKSIKTSHSKKQAKKSEIECGAPFAPRQILAGGVHNLSKSFF